MSATNDGFDQLAAPGYPIFLGSEIQHPRPDTALFHVLPVPFEASVSYGTGTGNGPAAILAASWQLELWDGSSCPGNQGIYTHPPVNTEDTAPQVIDNIATAVAAIAAPGNLPIILGGEHSVTYGAIKGLLNAGIKDIGLVQIDAHADLRDALDGNPHSHGSVMRRVVEEGIPLFQLGIRAFSLEEVQARLDHNVQHLDADILVPQNITEFELPEDFPPNVYFSLDIDGMDPSIFPATGTPVPGGLGWYQTLSLFECVARQRNIIGFDIMEFAPIAGFHAYEFAASQLTYKLMGIVERYRNR